MTTPRDTTVVPFPDRQQIREDAGVWVMRLERGLSDSERRELDAWLGESPLHVEALLELAELWDETSIARELAELFPLERYRAQHARRRTRVLALAAAAVLATLAVLVGVTALREREPEPAPQAASARSEPVREYATIVGAQSTVHLPDASTVMLNTNSAIEVRYSGANREIVLVRGEAFFDVRPDAARPFVVRVGEHAVRALGTAFNVRRGAGSDFRLMVTEGVVGVLAGPRAPAVVDRAADAAAQAPVDDEVRVDAGTVAVVDAGPVALEAVGVAALQDRLSWQRGMLIFDDEPLANVLDEVGRYTTVELVPDAALRDLPVSGYFRASDVDGLLFALKENFGIESVRTASDRILLTP